ncbi:MAG: hypothetical protein IKV00_08970 [Clostridia bacterium]|nr:hypothetical protein [Clostridia bacterium]
MTDAPNEKSTGGLADVLGSLMSNEALMSQIAKIVSEADTPPPKEPTPEQEAVSAPLPLDPQIMEKLPEVVAAIRPFLAGESAPQKPAGGGASSHRTALLCALKPYLSPRRREAIDYITRISKLGDVMKQMKF